MKNKRFFKFRTATILAAVVVVNLFTACSDDFFASSGNVKSVAHAPLKEGEYDNYFYKKKFAIALAKALYDSPELRTFIREKALEKFDNDFDVLYNYVKDDEVNGTGKSLRDFLCQYFEDEGELDEIARVVPLITIFVPTLPEDCFSAEKWDVSNQEETPLVAVSLRRHKDCPIFDSDGDGMLFPGQLIPGFSVVVVKDCERVILPEDQNYQDKETETVWFYGPKGTLFPKEFKYDVLTSKSGDFRFKFGSIYYEPEVTKTIEDLMKLIFDIIVWHLENFIGIEVLEAWDLYSSTQEHFWQRDYIYHGLTPQQPNGKLKEKYYEFLPDFEMTPQGNSPQSRMALLYALNDNPFSIQDPYLEVWKYRLKDDKDYLDQVDSHNYWHEGTFEFGFFVSMFENGTEKICEFRPEIAPQDLFDIDYESVEIWTAKEECHEHFHIFIKRHKWKYYKVTDIHPKTVIFNTPFSTRTVWDLSLYSNSIKVTIDEIDGKVEYQSVNGISHKFNSNWETYNEQTNTTTSSNGTTSNGNTNNYSESGTYKTGGKNGGSQEVSFTSQETIKYTDESDKLGTTWLYFGNPVMVKIYDFSPSAFYTYCTGPVSFRFRPMPIIQTPFSIP